MDATHCGGGLYGCAMLPTGTFTLEDHDILATDDHVVALNVMSVVRDGAPISVNLANVMHFRNGRQQERWFHPSDASAWDRLLGGPT